MTRDYLMPEDITEQDVIPIEELPDFYANKRIVGINTILSELAKVYIEVNHIWKYYSRNHLLIYSTAKDLRPQDMEEVKNWAMTFPRPEQEPAEPAITFQKSIWSKRR